jgi:cytochrome c
VTPTAQKFGFGRPATPEEIRAWDTSIMPDGTGLPPGGATAAEGRSVYDSRCARCHGATGKGPNDALVGGSGTLASADPQKTVGSYWPYATTLWDYIYRAMPFDQPGTMTAEQVYASVAYVLFLNGIVSEQQRIDARSLPRVRMPNREGFVPDDRPDVGTRVRRKPL